MSRVVLHHWIQSENDFVVDWIRNALFGYRRLLRRHLLDCAQVSHRLIEISASSSSHLFGVRSRSRVQGHGGAAAAAPGRTGSDWRLTKMILIIFVSFLFCYLPTAIIKVVDKKVERAGKLLCVCCYASEVINFCRYPFLSKTPMSLATS